MPNIEVPKIQAISGVFLDDPKDSVLLFSRTLKRTFNPGKLDVMGGDIKAGETPEEALRREAEEKLNIVGLTYEPKGTITQKEINAWVRRYVYLCKGDYSSLTLDPKKYDEARWVRISHINPPALTSGARAALIHLDLIPPDPIVIIRSAF